MKKNLVLLIVTVLISLSFFSNSFGPRIPITYFVTVGTGQSDEGIPPDPYETFSYDLALLEAKIEDFNVVYYTSVLPLESHEIPIESAIPYFHHGSVLECIMAKAGGYKGDTIAAGVGRVWAKDIDGNVIGGFAAEYERIYDREYVNSDIAYADARGQLVKSLKHELVIRNLSQHGEMKFDITSMHIEKKYGIALAALGFVNFIYPEPYPLDN